MWCTYDNFGREITRHTVMSEVLKSLAEVLQVQSADRLMSRVGQMARAIMYIWCTHDNFGREIIG